MPNADTVFSHPTGVLPAWSYLFMSCDAFCAGEKIGELYLHDNVIPEISTRIELNSTQ